MHSTMTMTAPHLETVEIDVTIRRASLIADLIVEQQVNGGEFAELNNELCKYIDILRALEAESPPEIRKRISTIREDFERLLNGEGGSDC